LGEVTFESGELAWAGEVLRDDRVEIRPPSLERVAVLPRPPKPERKDDETSVRRSGDYTLVTRDDGETELRKNGKLVRRVKEMEVAGGAVGLEFSPGGKYILHTWSRGGSELERVADGKMMGVLPQEALIAPNDEYAVARPTSVGPSGLQFDLDVVKLKLQPGFPKKKVGSYPEGVDYLTEAGVDICSGSAFFVASWVSELIVVRAADDTVVVRVPKPGPGVPMLSHSGKWLALAREKDEKSVVKIYALE
jgi:hypothetical protein